DFLGLLAECGSVIGACEAVGMSGKSVYRLRALPGAESFAAAWDAVPGARAAGARFWCQLCVTFRRSRPANSARACPSPAFGYPLPMNFDDLLDRYFGTADLAAASPAAREAGIDRLRVDFGLESDRGRKFALWAVLYMLGEAPDLDVAFKSA